MIFSSKSNILVDTDSYGHTAILILGILYKSYNKGDYDISSIDPLKATASQENRYFRKGQSPQVIPSLLYADRDPSHCPIH